MKLNKYLWWPTKWNALLFLGIMGTGLSILALSQNFGITILAWLETGYTEPWILGIGLLRMWFTWMPSIMWFLFSLATIKYAYKKTNLSKLIKEIKEG